jgi:transposase-like protein
MAAVGAAGPRAEKLRIVEETLDDRASISVVARRNGVAPNLLYRWRRLMLEGGVSPCPRTMT